MPRFGLEKSLEVLELPATLHRCYECYADSKCHLVARNGRRRLVGRVPSGQGHYLVARRSCTADKKGRAKFMGELGGTEGTFLELHTKTACDISSLSLYPHERESSLRLGTNLKVRSRTKRGKVAYIKMEGS
eukprot:scaffold9512_cov181-Amphora_coffeaeformis.AAC.5